MSSGPLPPTAPQMFEDRRREERRASTADAPYPPIERRRGERRRTQRRYQTAPWWLQINYAEELSGKEVASELRRIERARRRQLHADTRDQSSDDSGNG